MCVGGGGRGPARPVHPPSEKNIDTLSHACQTVNARQGWGRRGGGENDEYSHPPSPVFFFSSILHSFSFLNYKARNGNPIPPRSVVAFLMINSREILAVVAMEFSMKREFRKIQCPLFFSLDSYIYTYLYIYYICIYIYSFLSYGMLHFKWNVWSAKSSDGWKLKGEGRETGGEGEWGDDREEKKTPVSDIQR